MILRVFEEKFNYHGRIHKTAPVYIKHANTFLIFTVGYMRFFSFSTVKSVLRLHVTLEARS